MHILSFLIRITSVGSYLGSGSSLCPCLFLEIGGKGGLELDCRGGLAAGGGGVDTAEAQDPACGFSFPLFGLPLRIASACTVCGALEGVGDADVEELNTGI